jgi:hypothetical protein
MKFWRDYNYTCQDFFRARGLLISPRHVEGDGGAGAGMAFDGAIAADFGHALAHVPQAVGPCVLRRPFKALPVVGDDDTEFSIGNVHAEPHFFRTSVFDDIVQRFFYGEEKIVANVRRHVEGGWMFRQIKTAANAGRAKEIEGELAEVIDEVRQGIVARIDGPDDFIQGLHDLASS